MERDVYGNIPSSYVWKYRTIYSRLVVHWILPFIEEKPLHRGYFGHLGHEDSSKVQTYQSSDLTTSQ